MGIDKRRKYIMVVDVETAGGFGNPAVYDLGFAICDKNGRVYETRSFVIKDIYDNKALMNTAYYAKKIPLYERALKEGTKTKVSFYTARQEMFSLLRKYDVKTLSAYNLQFDTRALQKTMERICGKGFKFFTKEFAHLEKLCIWSFACEVLYTQKTFSKVARKNGWVSPKGNMQTTAEIGHRYISKEYYFEEEHMGLEDVRIEIGILAKCFRQKQKHESGVLPQPWRIPNRAA